MKGKNIKRLENACKQTVGGTSVFVQHTLQIINLGSVHGYSGRFTVHACWVSDIEMSPGMQTLNTLDILQFQRQKKNC